MTPDQRAGDARLAAIRKASWDGDYETLADDLLAEIDRLRAALEVVEKERDEAKRLLTQAMVYQEQTLVLTNQIRDQVDALKAEFDKRALAGGAE